VWDEALAHGRCGKAAQLGDYRLCGVNDLGANDAKPPARRHNDRYTLKFEERVIAGENLRTFTQSVILLESSVVVFDHDVVLLESSVVVFDHDVVLLESVVVLLESVVVVFDHDVVFVVARICAHIHTLQIAVPVDFVARIANRPVRRCTRPRWRERVRHAKPTERGRGFALARERGPLHHAPVVVEVQAD
jgi:hypothetical protein